MLWRCRGASTIVCDPLLLDRRHELCLPLPGDLEVNVRMRDHLDAPRRSVDDV